MITIMEARELDITSRQTVQRCN